MLSYVLSICHAAFRSFWVSRPARKNSSVSVVSANPHPYVLETILNHRKSMKNWQAQTSKQDQIEIIVANEKSIGPKQLMCLLSKINDLLHRFGHKHLFWFIVVLTKLTWEMSRPASTPALHKTTKELPDVTWCRMVTPALRCDMQCGTAWGETFHVHRRCWDPAVKPEPARKSFTPNSFAPNNFYTLLIPKRHHKTTTKNNDNDDDLPRKQHPSKSIMLPCFVVWQ